MQLLFGYSSLVIFGPCTHMLFIGPWMNYFLLLKKQVYYSRGVVKGEMKISHENESIEVRL